LTNLPAPFHVISLLIEGDDPKEIEAIAEQAVRLANEVAERAPCEVRIVALSPQQAEKWDGLLNE
jgi:hypothetical protein